MDARWEKLTEALMTLRDRLEGTPDVAITLGSGLSKAFGVPDGGRIIPAEDVPHYPRPSVAGHAGEFWAGRIGDKSVLVQRGRAHFYEGHGLDEIVFATRLFAMLGVKTLIVTNASGAINPDFHAGDLVVITDHINMLGANPLHGPNLSGSAPDSRTCRPPTRRACGSSRGRLPMPKGSS